MKRKMILVASPPACGKTYISRQIAQNLDHVVYLDKDALIPISRQIFNIADQKYNRSSTFFEENIRDIEYATIVEIAFEAILYEDIVLINAPFTQELKSEEYMKEFHSRLHDIGGELWVIWVNTSVDVCKERMISRNSDRDKWKLENWDEYIKTRDFSIPQELYDKGKVDRLYIFNNSSDEEYRTSMNDVLRELQGK